MTTATAPPILHIDFDAAPPQYAIGLPVWVSLDSDQSGMITGIKFTQGQWHYLVQDQGWECWAAEPLIVPIDPHHPILYKGYRIEVLPFHHPVQPYHRNHYTYQLVNLTTGETIPSNKPSGSGTVLVSFAQGQIDQLLEVQS